MAMMKTLEDFHAFFSQIPHENWITGRFIDAEDHSKRDALGHLFKESDNDTGYEPMPDAYQLLSLVQNQKLTLVSVNDKAQVGFPQQRPKARVLAFLERAMKDS